MAQLLSSFGKRGQNLGLATMKVDIEDTEYLSKYFVISEYNPVFLAGRNPVAFNGSSYLASGSEIKVECLDSQGNSLYIEQAKSTNSQFTDVSRFIISISIFAETYNGPGKLIFVGTTIKGETVRWIGKITIDKTLTNACKVRFYSNPTLDVRPLLYPVVDVTKAQQDVPPIVYSYPKNAYATIKSIVYSVKVTSPGVGYDGSLVTVAITGGGGVGASANAVVDIPSGTVINIILTAGGSGYTSNPTVTITGGGATTNATAEAQITNIVDTVTVDPNNPGSGYTSAPGVFLFGDGSGATATATIAGGKVTAITVTNGGFGYTTAPAVKFSGPVKPAAPPLNIPTILQSSCYAYAVDPPNNTNALMVDKKRTTIDYRLVATGFSNSDIAPTMFPTAAFNSQMEGSLITLNVKKVQIPSSRKEIDAVESNVVSNTFTIKKVLDSKTIILSDSFYYQVGKDQLITDIIDSGFTSSYNFIKYNTEKESNLTFAEDISAVEVPVKEFYAEITYRNLKTYSGFVARQKLYRRSLFHPGDFQLISDEPLGAIELLSDTITFNKAYTQLGTFYNQFHTDKYWFPSDSTKISITAKTFPINSGYINTTNPTDMDGNRYVILKTDSIGVTPNNKYYPYDKQDFDDLTGDSYNSNFISLKKDTLYSLTTNVIMEKEFSDITSKVSFYFTSSISSIRLEKDFDATYGLKIGEVSTTDQTKTKYFNGKQTLYFTPSDDYYGTLVVVPYHCNVTLSEVSLKVYGDYGFSPEILFIRIPFPINIKDEAFEIKGELFDINHNLIFSNLRTNQTFDALGESLNSPMDMGSVAYISPSTAPKIQKQLTVASSFNAADSVYFPNLELGDGNSSRLVGWIFPDGSESSGKLVYTEISNVSVIPTNNLGTVTTDDYINVTTVHGITEHNGRSIAVHYSGSDPYTSGRRVYVDLNYTKSVFR